MKDRNTEMKVVLHSNRAMTYLKLQEYLKAEIDCDVALAINMNHVKSLTRRATARKKLQKHKEALVDFQSAYSIE